MIECKLLGFMDGGTGQHQSNSVYSVTGLSPALNTCAGYGVPMFVESRVSEMENPIRLGNVYDEKFGPSFGGNVWDTNGIMPTLKTTAAASQQFVVQKVGDRDKSNYSVNTDIANCIPSNPMSDREQVMVEVRVLGKMDNSKDHSFDIANRVYDTNGLAPTIHTCAGGNIKPKIVSMRGRDEDNPTDRKKQNPDKKFKQRLEVQQGGEICGTLTTFQKDNMVLEPSLLGGLGEKKSNGGTQYYQQDRVYNSSGIAMAHPAQIPEGSYKYMVEEKIHQQDLVQSEDGISRTLVAGSHGNADTYTKTVVNYRIRKLTPKECFRLMGVKDEDYDKLTVSNSQKYKQAGNSIVVDVLESIFENMFINECKSNSLF